MGTETGKREAQQRVDNLLTFRRQLEELRHQGVLELSAEQRCRLDLHLDATLKDLAERFDVDTDPSQKQFSLGMRVLSTLGGLAFCAALYLFFFRFWGSLTAFTQATLLILAPLLGLPALDFLARKEKTGYYTTLISLVVLTSFALNLGVLGNRFNITSAPGIFLACGVFALILAYRYGLCLPLIAGIVSLLIFGAGMLTIWAGGFWEAFLQCPEFLIGGGLLVLSVPFLLRHRRHPNFKEVYYWLGLLLLFSSLEALIHGGKVSFLPFDTDMIETIYRLLAFLASGLTIAVGIRLGLLGIVNLGCCFFALYLFDQLFRWWWDWMPKYLFCLILGILAILLLAVFRKMRRHTQEQSS
jgi:hypothetical protein